MCPIVAETTPNIYISKRKTFEAAQRLVKKYPDKKVAVLNFASATTPGGGVVRGSRAQEESLCRCSTLYNVLNAQKFWNEFYTPNRRANNPLHKDDCIYSPDIVVFKTDDGNYNLMPQRNWYKVDVVTCAAPNLRSNPSNKFNVSDGKSVDITDDELYDIHFQRAFHILTAMRANDVDIAVLGAFGCGAFKNDPRIVAKAYFDVIREYDKQFFAIEFAIYCNDYETENYMAFCHEFKQPPNTGI